MRWLGVVLASALLACEAEPDVGTAPSETAAPVSVTVSVIAQEAVVQEVVGSGTLAAHKTTNIGPRVSGIIDEILVKVSDRVEVGDVLFRTRADDYEIRVRKARAQARLATADAEKLARDLRRIEKLHAQGVASEGRLDEVRTSHETALARREAAEAGLAEARQNLADTSVRAPYRGVVTGRYVDEGAMMSTIMSANAQVVQIMKMDIVAAIIQIPEIHLSRIRVGTPARVSVDGVDGVFESEIYILNDRVDHISRAVEVRLPIENRDYALKPGLFVRAELVPEPRNVVVVPRNAVLGPNGARYVFVHEDEVARRRDVTVRELDTRRMEVMAGLAVGESVLSGPNLPRVSDGTAIAIELAHADR